VSYRNAALQEGKEDDFDAKEVAGGESVASIEEIKAAEPEFSAAVMDFGCGAFQRGQV